MSDKPPMTWRTVVMLVALGLIAGALIGSELMLRDAVHELREIKLELSYK